VTLDLVNPARAINHAPNRAAENRAAVESYPKRLRQKARHRVKRASGLGRRWIGRLQSGQTITPDVPGAHRLLVWLDGVPQDYVTALNIREGWLERFVREPYGWCVAADGGGVKTERVRGRIALKMRPEA